MRSSVVERTCDLLVSALFDPSEDVWSLAISSVEKLGPEVIPERLVQALSGDTDRVKQHAACTIGWLCHRHPELLERICGTAAASEVVAHPEVPVAVLRTLGEQLPEELVNNPVFPLMLVACPDVFGTLSGQARSAIAQHAGIPARWLSHRSATWQTKAAVARGVCTPGNLLEVLSVDPSAFVRGQVAANESTPVRVLRVLSTDGESEVRSSVAQHPKVPAEVLAALCRDSDGQVRSRVAAHPRTPVETLERMCDIAIESLDGQASGSAAEDVLIELAQQPRATGSMLGLLAIATSLKVRRIVARRSDLPEDLVTRLAGDPEEKVRWAVASRVDLSWELITQLAEDPEVAGVVAANPSAPAEVLTRLSKSGKWTWENSVASNPSVPATVLAALSRAESVWVRRAVAENPRTESEVLAGLALDEDKGVRRLVASHSNTTLAVIELLAAASDDCNLLRAQLAKNPNTPAHLLRGWAQDWCTSVLENMASNPSAPADLLESLSEREDREIRSRVARNPSAPDHMRRKLEPDDDGSPPRADTSAVLTSERSSPRWEPFDESAELVELAASSDMASRRQAVRHRRASPMTLAVLAWDEETGVREAVAAHSSTPEVILKLLRDQGNRVSVKRIAEATLRIIGNPSEEDVYERCRRRGEGIAYEVQRQIDHDERSDEIHHR